MEDKVDRLEDIIHVLRNHAVGGTNTDLTNELQSLIRNTHNGPIKIRTNSPAFGLVTNGIPTDVSSLDHACDN